MTYHEAYIGNLAVMIAAILVFWALLRLVKVKSFAVSFALGYIVLVVYTIIQGWNPLSVGAFQINPPELIAITWPSSLLERFLPSNLKILVLLAGTLQYCAAGWVIDLIADSIFSR